MQDQTFFSAIIHYFDKLEDRVRERLSHRSIFYAALGGFALVIFWRGVWHTADILQAQGGFWGWFFYEPITIVWASLLLLMTGLFVSVLIGQRLIISSQRREKQVTDKEDIELKSENEKLNFLFSQVEKMSQDMEEIKNALATEK